MTDAQLTTMYHDTGASLWMIGNFLNSAAMWELLGGFMGLLITLSLITALVTRMHHLVGFRSRD